MANTVLKHPVYIVSKGRWENPITAKYFLRDKIPFQIAIEPQEYDLYCQTIPKQYISVLPFSNLGFGSYPARNWCWDDSIKKKHTHHFLFDDNIRGFDRLNNGLRVKCESMTPLITLQDFVDRYSNIGIAGFNYDGFVTRETKKPFAINTHVYSAMLIRNDIKFRWRLKYNEDVDLCLQVLHTKKLTTVLFNVFVVNKTSTTAKMKGGNQDELYKNNDELKKALKTSSLQQVWPQYVKMVYRYGRPHHQVSWNKFFNQPLLRKSVILTRDNNRGV